MKKKTRNLKIVDVQDNIEIYQKSSLYSKIARDAAHEAKIRNESKNIPAAFMQDGIIYYELPDGTITKESPWDE